jgi:hypothetical protein
MIGRKYHTATNLPTNVLMGQGTKLAVIQWQFL